LALDSLVFDRADLRAMAPRTLLWKKFLAWAKPTQRRHLRSLARSLQVAFVACAQSKTNARYARKHRFHKGFQRAGKFRFDATADRMQMRRNALAHRASGAKQDGFCARVHSPLSGVGVFFVALV
jgi:hypothetical protein